MDGVLDHVMLGVSGLKRSHEWYRTHLDDEKKDRYESDGFTIFYLGRVE